MPSYDFQCRECGERFDVRCAWQDKAQVRCPKCGGEDLQEIFSGFTFLTAGGGGGGGCAPSSSGFS